MRGPTRTGNTWLLTRKNLLTTQSISITLLALNVIGAVAYVFRASPGWAIPEERGLHSITGEPFIWFIGVLPVVVIFFVLNLAWGALIVARRQWRSGRFWLLAAVVWLIAVLVDFAHH